MILREHKKEMQEQEQPWWVWPFPRGNRQEPQIVFQLPGLPRSGRGRGTG